MVVSGSGQQQVGDRVLEVGREVGCAAALQGVRPSVEARLPRHGPCGVGGGNICRSSGSVEVSLAVDVMWLWPLEKSSKIKGGISCGKGEGKGMGSCGDWRKCDWILSIQGKSRQAKRQRILWKE